METPFRLGEWLVEPRRDQVIGADQRIKIEPRAMRLLICLSEHPGEVVTREQLLEEVWQGAFVSDEVLTSAVRKLRKALGDDAHAPRFIQTLPGEGYRLNAPVSRITTKEAPRKKPARFWALVVAATIMTGAVAFFILPDRTPPGIGASGRPAIAIFDFEDFTGSEDLQWLSRGVPNMLLTDLAQTMDLDTVSRERIDELWGKIGEDEGADRDLILEVARRAGAGAILTGGVYESCGELRIDVQLEDVSTGRVLMAESVKGDDAFPMVNALTRSVRSGLRLADAQEDRPIAEVSTASLRAYRFYTEGREAIRQGHYRDARRMLREALEADPDFIMTYVLQLRIAGLDPETRRRHWNKILENLDRLPERDRLLVEAEYVRRDDPTKAVGLLETLIDRHPDEEEAYTRLEVIYRLELGDDDKARATLERGIEAIPVSGVLRNYLAILHLLNRGHHQEAIHQLELAREIDIGEPNPLDSLGVVYLVMGEHERALENFERALGMRPDFYFSITNRVWALSVVGRYDDLFERIATMQDDGTGFGKFPPVLLAHYFARLGRFDESERELAEHRRNAAERGVISPQIIGEISAAGFAIDREQYEQAREHADRALTLCRHLAVPTRLGRSWHKMAANLLGGTAEARSGNVSAARSRLDLQRELYQAHSGAYETWWYHALEGEISLAAGDLPAAEKHFLQGLPRLKMPHYGHRPLNQVWCGFSRDGLARVKKEHDDLNAAIELYLDLITPGIASKWTLPFEPRFLLELARLYDETGDAASAREHYRRFLEYWKDADPKLPEVEEAQSRLSKLEGLEDTDA